MQNMPDDPVHYLDHDFRMVVAVKVPVFYRFRLLTQQLVLVQSHALNWRDVMYSTHWRVERRQKSTVIAPNYLGHLGIDHSFRAPCANGCPRRMSLIVAFDAVRQMSVAAMTVSTRNFD